MRRTFISSLAAIAAALLASTASAATPDPAASAAAYDFFEQAFEERVALSPIFQAYLGRKTNNKSWDDLSDAAAFTRVELVQRQLAELHKTVDRDQLDEQNQLSYDLFIHEARREVENFSYRLHNYPVNQMHGQHASAAAFLINIHRVDDIADARAYIARLHGLRKYMAQLEAGLWQRAEIGVIPPQFVFPYVISDSRNVIAGGPFEAGAEDGTLLADFRGKLKALDIDANTERELTQEAVTALLESVRPAYESLIRCLEQLAKEATTDDGAWKLPDGADYYRLRLRNMTTTDMTPEEIHATGLAEVERIHAEMRDIMRSVEYDGTLREFFAFMRDDPRFYYANDDQGRAAYLARATDLIDTMQTRLPEFFGLFPKADMVVRRVESFREKSAGKAFYQRPAPDGSRPGVYYANLYNMADMPIYQMEALAYHEGIPGHHMQIAISLELDGIPRFRKWGGYTAYTEGWGLYSEFLPKEHGFYADPYSDFGRLAMELWRAGRLVVDTGIHEMRWTRERAIEWLATNTPNPHGDVVKAIERYIVTPGQATAYKIGQLRILALRQDAMHRLGEQFSLSAFHDVVLGSGPVPLSVLEARISAWVSRTLTQPKS